MKNRIDQKFQDLKDQNKKAFIAFITAGDPDLKTTEQLVYAFEDSGVDIIELGVPFSDPLADGPTIQAASKRALDKGITLKKIFLTVKKIRQHSQIPLALMMYYNQVFHYGQERFVKDVKDIGIDGSIIPDLPPDEAVDLMCYARKQDVSTVFFLSPTTKVERIKQIAQASTGFIYFVSLTGVTGARQSLPEEVIKQIKLAKKYTTKPICVGFGISKPEQIKILSSVADGVIVGSAIINEILRHQGKKDFIKQISKYVQSLTRVL